MMPQPTRWSALYMVWYDWRGLQIEGRTDFTRYHSCYRKRELRASRRQPNKNQILDLDCLFSLFLTPCIIAHLDVSPQSVTYQLVSCLSLFVPNLVSLTAFELLEVKYSWLDRWPFIKSLVMWLFNSPWLDSYLSLIVNNLISLTAFHLFELKYSWPWAFTSQGHRTSLAMLAMWLFDSPWSVSSQSLIVTNLVSVTVYELFELKCSWPWPWGSSHVIGCVAIRQPMAGFLSVLNGNQPRIAHRFRVIWAQILVTLALAISCQWSTFNNNLLRIDVRALSSWIFDTPCTMIIPVS